MFPYMFPDTNIAAMLGDLLDWNKVPYIIGGGVIVSSILGLLLKRRLFR